MISLLPILCALGLLVSPSAAHPATNFNKAITRVQPMSHASLATRGRVHANMTSWAATDVIPAANATGSLDKRGTRWGKYKSYSGDAFMDESLWDYWTRDDPTHGKVK